MWKIFSTWIEQDHWYAEKGDGIDARVVYVGKISIKGQGK